jgi:hypothetical protein
MVKCLREGEVHALLFSSFAACAPSSHSLITRVDFEPLQLTVALKLKRKRSVLYGSFFRQVLYGSVDEATTQ